MNLFTWMTGTHRGRLLAAILWPELSASVALIGGTEPLRMIILVIGNWIAMLLWIAFLTRGRLWFPFHGYSMEANLQRIREQPIENQITVQKEIEDWAKNMAGRFRYKKINDYRYAFLRKRDAMAFKLVWG